MKIVFKIFFLLVIIILISISMFLLGYYYGGKDFLKTLHEEIQDLDKEDEEK